MKFDLPRRVIGFSIICCLGAPIGAHAQSSASVQTNLLPSMDNPKLQFGTGRVVDNKPEMSPVEPDLPGDISAWKITEFNPLNVVSGDRMTQGDPATHDSVLGPAAYGFDAPDGHAHVWLYKNPATGHLVYELYESGGSLGKGGGRDILLAANLNKPFPTLDHQINFSMQAKISRADVTYDNPQAMSNGAVLAQVGMAFILQFPSPVDGTPSTLFLQVTLAHSGKREAAGLLSHARFAASCTAYKNGALGVMTVGTISGMAMLPFKSDHGPLHDISFSVNDYFNKLIATPLSCASKGQGQQTISLQNVDLSQVVLKHVYIGPETEISDHRGTSAFTGPQGTVDMGIQVSNMQITEGGAP